MKIVLTVAVRNTEWHWTKEQLEEAGDYRKEWEAINGDKIYKHAPSWQYEIPYDVKNIEANRNADFEVRFTSEDKTQNIGHTISDVTIIQFNGERETEMIEVVISNSLINQYIAAKQKHYKYYVYFYLKENSGYEKLHELVWVSDEHKKEIEKSLAGSFQKHR